MRLFFPNPNPPLERAQIEELPVIAKLKEYFTQGGANRDTGLVTTNGFCMSVTSSSVSFA
jgi:hypothetical protein